LIINDSQVSEKIAYGSRYLLFLKLFRGSINRLLSGSLQPPGLLIVPAKKKIETHAMRLYGSSADGGISLRSTNWRRSGFEKIID